MSPVTNNIMKQTKKVQTNKPTELVKWNPDNIDGARILDEWNNSWELYKPMRTLNNY